MFPHRCHRCSAVVVAILFIALAWRPAAAAEPEWASSAQRAAVDALFASVDSATTPGCALSIRRHGGIVMTRQYGVADLENPAPIRAGSVFEAGSVSKQFTAAAIAVLATRRALQLDDAIGTHLPELPQVSARITIRQLLNHSSGLRDYGDLVALAGWPRGSRVYTQAQVLAMLAKQVELNFPPGSEYSYSNSNYVLAALIVERVSGQSLDAFTREQFFVPFGMRDTRWRDDFSAIVPGRAIAYSLDGSRWSMDMPFENVIGHAGLLSTVGDLQKWNAQLADPTPANAAWVALLTERGRLANGHETDYGLGLEIAAPGEPASIGHAGATAGYRAFLARYPEAGLSVALLCNAGSLNSEALGPQLAAIFLPPPPPRVQARSFRLDRPTRRDLADVAGLYRNRRSGAPVTLTSDAAGVHVNGGSAYVAAGRHRFRSSDGRRVLTLSRGAAATVESVHIERANNSAIDLRPVAAWRPDAGQLDAYAGRYRSDETDATFSVHASDDGIAISGEGYSASAAPAYADHFNGDAGLFAFERDAAGAVVAFRLSETRSRGIRFVRVTTH